MPDANNAKCKSESRLTLILENLDIIHQNSENIQNELNTLSDRLGCNRIGADSSPKHKEPNGLLQNAICVTEKIKEHLANVQAQINELTKNL